MPESNTRGNNGNSAYTNTTPNANIDIDKLTEKVYQLMRAEIRQERARGTKRTMRK